MQLTGQGKNVLELGAASGHVTAELTKRGNRVTAVEIDISNRDLLSQAAEKVIIADLDRLDLVEKLQGEKFDVIIAGDVLEHTTKSGLILLQLHELLKEDGYVVASIPNIAHGDVRLTMLQGNFPYAESGLLDKTHLQFFTRSSVKELFNDNGFDIAEIYHTIVALGQTELQVNLSLFDKDIVDYIRNAKDSSVYQFIVKAFPHLGVKMASAQLSRNTPPLSDISADELQLELGLLKKKMRILENDRVILRNDKVVLENDKVVLENDKVVLRNDQVVLENSYKSSQSELTLATLGFRDYTIGLLAELAEFKARDQIAAEDRLIATDALRAEMTKGYETGKTLVAEMTKAYAAETLVLKLQAEVANIQRLQNELDALRQSRAFKIGRTITAPMRILRRIFS